MNFSQFLWPIAEIILCHRYFISKLNYPITGPRLLQYLCPSGYSNFKPKRFSLGIGTVLCPKLKTKTVFHRAVIDLSP